MSSTDPRTPRDHPRAPGADAGHPAAQVRFFSSPPRVLLAAAVALLLAVLAGVAIGSQQPGAFAAEAGVGAPTAVLPPDPSIAKRDFLFQVEGYETANQGGQTMNMYFHYRYTPGITTADIPNYLDLRSQALAFMDAVDFSANPYWETLGLDLCTQLKDDYPLEAISCQLQVYPDNREGLPYEPGYHASITTLGDIEPLAYAGPLAVADEG